MRKILIISMLLIMVGCGRNQDNPEEGQQESPEEKDEVIINVEASTAYEGPSIATFRSTAILEADRAAKVTTKTSGIILDILVEEGDVVTKGQLLLVLESDEQRLSVKSARANYEKSLNNYQRAKQLIEKGLTNKEQIDNLKFETEVLKASLEQAEMNLSFTEVRSPFDGVVVDRLVKIGNLIQNATAVFEVIDFNSLQAKIDVPEHQWNIMQSGLQVQFDFDVLPNQTITGVVNRISPMVDPSSGTFEVTVDVNNENMLLRPGLFAKANIVYDMKPNATLVNKDAIIREDELSYVYVLVNEEEIEKVTVELGYEMTESMEIIAGLAVGQKVVTTGKNNLTPDAKVNVVSYDEVL